MTLLRNLPLLLVTVLDSAGRAFLSRDDFRAASTYYVDSENGDDANDGNTASAPFQTFSALPSLSSGDVIGIACGSTFAETLSLVDGVKVGAYVPPQTNNTNRPIIDCSDSLTGFTKTGGYTNIYQITLTKGATSNSFINAFEDGAFMSRATSLANCDATSGSFIVSSNTGANPTLYIHASDSGNPDANGSAYRGAVRLYSIDAFGHDNVLIFDIHGRRNISDNGSIAVGRNSTLHSCRASQGTKHNAYVQSGSLVEDCTFDDYQYNSTATLIVYNENSPSGGNITIRGCTFDGVDRKTSVTGVFGHINSSGAFGNVLVDDCTFETLNIATALGDCSLATVSNSNISDTISAIQVGEVDHVVDNVTFTDTTTGGTSFLTTSAVGATATLSNITATLSTSGAASAIFISQNDCDITVEDSDFTHTGVASTSGVLFIQAGNTGSQVTWNRNESDIDAGSLVRDLSTTLTYVGDNNDWCSSATFYIMRYHNSDLGSLAAWKTATGQDTNSDQNLCA